MSTEQHGSVTPYFVPEPNIWPNVINVGIFLLLLGFVLKINDLGGAIADSLLMLSGTAVLLIGAFAWIADVASENKRGLFKPWEERSFRIGMAFFIFAELMFFAAFIGSLMYVRVFSLPWLHIQGLNPGFMGSWPSGLEGKAVTALDPFGVPLFNTVLLLCSSISLLWANAGIAQDNRGKMFQGLIVTLLLGVGFLFMQVNEYGHAATEFGLLMSSGAYGTMFYMLTGFHGVHLLVGLIIVATILVRALRGHFSADNYFGVKGTGWYWNYIVVVPGLLVYIYFYLI
ncbi:Cytochrome aa3 subunit 3 [Gammaproteobacteria bacterium]